MGTRSYYELGRYHHGVGAGTSGVGGSGGGTAIESVIGTDAGAAPVGVLVALP